MDPGPGFDTGDGHNVMGTLKFDGSGFPCPEIPDHFRRYTG